MDKFIDARFERLQKVIAEFIESLVKNNPSLALARDLVTADEELHAGLKQLELHQNNWARIAQLRKETEENDVKIKDIVTELWTIRKELAASTISTYSRDGPVAPFTLEELLAYARRIAPHSRPPPGVINGLDASTKAPSPAAPETEAGPSAAAAGPAQTPTAGDSFYGGIGPSAAPTPTANGDSQLNGQPSQETTLSASTALPDHLQPAVNVNAGVMFKPWPDEDMLQRGALGAYQRLVNQGIDPIGYDPAAEERRKQEEEQQRKDAEERQRVEREDHERRMREERERMLREREEARQENLRRGSIAEPGPSSGAEKKQFQFIGMDDDDDDD
ncbi:hypothetical protein P8C59_000683 [Phyllachora maydis]|uniref:Mediator of RNA polymerase II transcription subunit 4 n=1 Tax=Phyllachora maydis TaxID=1825666 RepID=A0AAD9HXW8_9PEZI|nr:hypothetical protein P8C59_000683 [Phyllachora maydis]